MAKFSRVSKIHSATFWRPEGIIFAPRVISQNARITTIARPIHRVSSVDEMLGSKTTRPGGVSWPGGYTTWGAGSSRLPLMKQTG